MKQLSPELKAHLAQEVTTLATCWKITRRDGAVLGFTDHDADLSYDGETYAAASGFSASSVESSSALNVDNMEIAGLLQSDVIAEPEVLSGLYDYAAVEVFMVNYAAPEMGRLLLRTGWLGEVQLKGKQFTAELRGLSQKLSAHVGAHYTAGCRADFGDARCGVNLADFTVNGVVSSSADRREFIDMSRAEQSGYFAGGKVTFTSGNNAGLSMEVKEFSAGRFILVLPIAFTIEAGDAYTAIAGCDKRLSTCAGVFNNAINFRGEPHVPGLDWMTQTAATRPR